MNNSHRTPFDQQTPLGYVASFSIQVGAALTGVAMMVSANTLFFAICWYNDGLVNDVISMLREMNASILKTTNNDSRALHKTICFHNEVIG